MSHNFLPLSGRYAVFQIYYPQLSGYRTANYTVVGNIALYKEFI